MSASNRAERERLLRLFGWSNRVDQRRRELSRLAFRLLRNGAGAAALASHLRDANGQLAHPLEEAALRDLAVSCVRCHAAEKNAS